MKRMRELIETLNLAAQAYYQEDREIMSNLEYDKIYEELENLEKKTGIVLSGSLTQKVGFEVLSSLKKVRHESKMLSLDKTKEVSALKSFLASYKGLLSFKLDGLTIVLKYLNGHLHQAITRGNGEIGEDVTHNAKVFKNVPIKISYLGELIVRGEAVITYEDFNKINENLQQEGKYKNPRNLCSGTVRQLNSAITEKRNVRFFAFSVVKAEGVDFEDSKFNQLKWVQELGFETVYSKVVCCDTLENEILDFEKEILNNLFGSDGLVLTYDSLSLSESLGETSKFPKDSIAFKWEDETKETTLLEIKWNTSRTGLINPVAIFEPVELEGTTVNKASLHNVSILENLQLGLGDKITVYKANMIIPQVAENLTKSNSAVIPDKCPECDGDTEIVQANEGKALYCMNPGCKAQLVRALSHYTSRDAMNVEGLSEATLEKFVERNFIKNYTDLYALEQYENEIKTMEGFGEKSYVNLINSIEKSKDVALFNFIYALGINQVGLSNAKLLCKNYQYDLEQIKNATEEELNLIEGFGKIIAASVVKYFNSNKNLELINKVLQYLRITAPEINENPQNLSGLTFVITGEVIEFKNRNELKEVIESRGGKVSSSISSKTSYLINNDITSSSGKNKKANELNIEIINEETFISKFIN